MKRVLLIEPCYEDYGGYYRAFGMARALALSGFKVDLLISARKRFSFRIEKQIVNGLLTVYKLPRIQFNPWSTGRWLRAFLGLCYCLFRKYDVIHVFTIVQVESLVPFLFLRLVMPWKKVILDWDDYWTDTHMFHTPTHRIHWPIVKGYLKFCEYKVQRLAKHGTVTSEFLRDEFEKLSLRHCFKMINGVDLEQCGPVIRSEARELLGIEQDARILLSFGNTFNNARTVDLINLFAEILKLDSDAVLLINRDPEFLWQKYAGGKQLDPAVMSRIRNVGYLEGDRLSNHLGACDAVLFLMGDSTCEKACFPTRIGTFLNGERIIVANETDTEACRVLKESGCAIIDSSLARLAERALAAISDESVRARYEESARKARHALSWEQLAPDLSSFYQEVLDG